MGTSGTARRANFSYSGIVVNAASAALFLYISGHGAAIFRDGLRLALISFLLSAALWAQIDFIAMVINTTATMTCQVALIFTTFFDQLGRFSIEQYLLWAIHSGDAATGWQRFLMQSAIGLRFVLGMVFVGLSRPQFDPVCVPISSVLPIAILVVALDAAIIAGLAIQSFSSGKVREVREGQPGAVRSKSILLVIVGMAIWTAVG